MSSATDVHELGEAHEPERQPFTPAESEQVGHEAPTGRRRRQRRAKGTDRRQGGEAICKQSSNRDRGPSSAGPSFPAAASCLVDADRHARCSVAAGRSSKPKLCKVDHRLARRDIAEGFLQPIRSSPLHLETQETVVGSRLGGCRRRARPTLNRLIRPCDPDGKFAGLQVDPRLCVLRSLLLVS